MSRSKTAAVLGAGALSLLLVGGVAPTAAATEAKDSAYAISASGIVSVPKTPHVVGSGKESLVAADLPPAPKAIVHTGVLNAEADKGYAKASLKELAIALPGAPKIEAELIAAECDDLSGSTTLASLKVGDKGIKIDQIKPNTRILPQNPLANIVLNKQVENKDGSLTVTAIAVDLLAKNQTLNISSATCTEKKGGQPPETSEPTEPSKPSEPSKPTETSKPGDDGGDNGEDLPGDEPDENGNAPRPTPQPGHLDVTG